MSKYRVEFKPSKFQFTLQLLSCVIFLYSIYKWQPDVLLHQIVVQVIVACFICTLGLIALFKSFSNALSVVVFSYRGDWIELNQEEQTAWRITNRSRVSSFLLFIHLVSPVNAHQSKWRLVYKDQITEREFRRLCRTLIYQQHSAGNDES